MKFRLPLVIVALLVVQISAGTAAVGGPAEKHPDAEVVSPANMLESLDDADVPPVLLPPLAFSRHDDSDSLENDNRRSIYELVSDSPGIHLAGVTETIDIPESTVSYHVRVLEREGLIRTETVRGKRRLCPASTESIKGVAALSDAATAPVLKTVQQHEPVTVSRIATEVGRAQSTVSYHLSRLEDDELLVRDRTGESVYVSLTPKARGLFDAKTADA